jgi:hypothetical protein
MSASAQADVTPRWGRVGRTSGYVAAATLLAGTVLFLLDSADLLADDPEFHRTSAGPESDIAHWYVAYFDRQHDILWDIAIRDTIIPVGFVALIVLAVATANVLGWRAPAAQLMVVFFALGGLLHIVNDLLYLGELHYWRHAGWSADPPGPMVAVGRASEAIDAATVYFEAAAYAVLFVAFVCLGRLCRTSPRLPDWLGVAAYLEAGGMVLLTLGLVADSDVLFQVGGLATGVVLGPLVAASLGRQLEAGSRAADRRDLPATAR